jgi:hypothetical protein
MSLSNIVADAVGNNAAVIEEIRRTVAALVDDTPFVLWPVRIETRFVQREAPRPGGVSGARELIDGLNILIESLESIAKTKTATDLKGKVKEKKFFKRDVEKPVYEFLEKQIVTASAAANEVRRIWRDAADANEAETKTLTNLTERGNSAVKQASASIGSLRSPFQRARFQKEFAPVQALTTTTLAQIEKRLMPTFALLNRLRERERIPISDLEKQKPLPVARLTESAESFERVIKRLADTVAALSAPNVARRLDRSSKLAKDIVDSTAAAIADVNAIALLPGDWKTELMAMVVAGRPLVERLATALERGAAGGAVAAKAALGQARELRANMAKLEKAIAAVRSDDRRLDDEVAPGRRDTAVELSAGTVTVHELWVRIFPDDIAVETHDARLTSSERDSGEIFWNETLAAGGNETLARGAWRALCLKHGSNRAAWLALQTQPADKAEVADAKEGASVLDALTAFDRRLEEVSASEPGKRLTALMRAAETTVETVRQVKSVPPAMLPPIRRKLEIIKSKVKGFDAKTRKLVEAGERPRSQLDPILERLDRWFVDVSKEAAARGNARIEFPDVALKQASWSSAPHSGVLPNRFVVITANGNRATHVVAGNQVNPNLKLGLDPDPANAANEQYTLDANGNLVVGDSIRWMVDFDEAIRSGMGVKISITHDEAVAGFDRVYVLGVRTDNRDQGRARLEALIDNHHYGQNSLALVPIGTATNNAEAETAGYKSTDDPDESFAIERGPALFDIAAAPASAADGLRLARALGVDPVKLTHVDHAGGQDVNEALLMNRVLWPATFGSFLEEFFGSLMPIETRDWIAEFALTNVTARGSIPGFRVGPQPYGVLPATVFSAYVPATGRAAFPDPPRNQAERRALFNRLLRDVLLRMGQDWTALRQAHVKHAHSTGVADFQQHFLDILGLEATSATSGYRLSLNCARRHPPADPDDLLDFGVPAAGTSTGAAFGPVALLERFTNVFRDALRLGPGNLIVDGRVSPVFEAAHKRLLHSRAYEVRHLREPKPLLGESIGADVAVWIPQLLAAAPNALVNEARTGAEARPLLYLLIRHALLNQVREATLRILAVERMLTDVARRLASSSDEFLVSTLSQDFAVTQWNYLFAPLSELDGRFEVVFPAGAGTFYDYLRAGGEKTMAVYLENRGDNAVFRGFAGRGRHTPFVNALTAHANDTLRLGQIPAERLDQLLFEHLDVVSHRLDAWLTGLATERLAEMRQAQPRGTYIGAYGWVEDLRPDATHPLASNVPPALISDAQPIYTDVENQGFIHGPSLNHAVTAAILRSGYLSETAQPDVENRMAVNLSSRRVRLALSVIEGVRAGNDLGSLLGYQFERFLHEAYANEGVTLDDLIAPLRRTFPSTVPVDENLSSPEASRQIVVDGLALHQTVQAWIQDNAVNVAPGATVFDVLFDNGNYSLYPFGLQAANGQVLVPPTTDAVSRRRLDGLLRALDNLADAVDAVGDLVVAEGVYQIAQGNHVRAAAAVSALAQGKAPPRPEIVDTPRSGTLVSQRLFLQIPPVEAFRGTLPAGWEGLPETPRSIAEPSLNNWLGALLGPAQNLRARIFDPDDVQVAEVSAPDLEMQPIDLLALFGPGFDQGAGEFAAYLLDTHRPAELDDEAPPAGLRVEFQRDPAWVLDVKSFVEIAPLLESVWDLLTRGRSATAHDWVLEETAADGGALLSGSIDDELFARVTASLDLLSNAGVELIEILSDDADDDPALLLNDPRGYVLSQAEVYLETVAGRRVFRDLDAAWARRDELFDALAAAASFGISQIDPPVAFTAREVVLRELFEKIESAFIEVATRVQSASKKLAEAPAAGSRTDGLRAAAKAIFGEPFVICPQFQLRNPETIAASLAAKLAPAGDPSLDGWLHGVAAVRSNAARLARVVTLADAFSTSVLTGVPAQLPHVDGDPWLGAELPAGYRPASDRLSLVVFGRDALNTQGGPSTGILVDQWSEVIPASEETTGVAIHYDQPDSMPPQCLLLAVPPERRGAWSWDELVMTLHETLELAKNRAVELEHLHHDLYGQILPGIAGELVPVDLPERSGEIPDSRLILDFGKNNPAVPA